MSTQHVVAVPELPDSPTARQVLRIAIAKPSRQLIVDLPAIRAGVDPRAVHRARVATRRIRSHLKVFGPMFDRDWAKGLRADLRRFGGALGEVRDLDVLLATLADLTVTEPAVVEADANLLITHFVRIRAEHRQGLLAALDHDQTTRTLDDLVAAAADPRTRPIANRPARDVFPRIIRRPWRRLQNAVGALDPHPAAEELHAVRILAKRCRYTAEAVRPVAGGDAKRFARAMADIQSCLGAVNDAVTIDARLRSAAEADPAVGFIAGQISGILADRAEARRDDFWPLWERASKRRIRNWR
jgi:CHAD domain-containing protein